MTTDCNTVREFLNLGGIVAVVLLFTFRDIVRLRVNAKIEAVEDES